MEYTVIKFYAIGQTEPLKFKVKSREQAQSNDSSLPICRIRLNACETDMLQALKTSVITKFDCFGLTQNNFDVYWHDSEDNFTIIADDDDLSDAIEELNGPWFDLIACFKSIFSHAK